MSDPDQPKKPLSSEDLRRSFEPFAGDPVADAERVLARIVGDRVRPRPTGPMLVRQTVLPVLCAAAGLVLGLLLFRGGAEDFAPGGAKDPRLLVSRGRVFLEHDGTSRLLPTGARIPAGSTIYTDKGSQCVVAMPGGKDFVLDAETRCGMRDDLGLEIDRGRVYAHVVRQPGPSRDDALVYTAEGNARLLQDDERPIGRQVFVVGDGRMQVVSDEGQANILTRDGDIVRVGVRKIGTFKDGKLVDSEDRPYVSDRLDWVTDFEPFLEPAPWVRDLEARLPAAIEGLGDEERWMEVDLVCRHMGPKVLDELFGVLERYADSSKDRDRQRRYHAAGLISNLADYRYVDRMFHWLMDDAPRVRASMFFGLERLVGSFYDERSNKAEFWQTASAEDRTRERRTWMDWVYGPLKKPR